MFKEHIKVFVPNEDISEAVQKKLFEMGVDWVAGGCIPRWLDSPYLFIENKEIWRSGIREEFENSHEKQVHYLQILVGDFEGEGKLFGQGESDNVYYQYNGYAWWWDGELFNVAYDLDSTTTTYSLDVNENKIEENVMNDGTNPMSRLEAGKHVVKMWHEHLQEHGWYLVVGKRKFLWGVSITGDESWANLDNTTDYGRIEEVHKLPYPNEVFDVGAYSPDTCIWKHDPNAERKQEIEKQIMALQKELEGL